MKGQIGKRFFSLPTLEVARGLLGMRLITNSNGVETSGMIVEVEAYRGDIDEASHSFKGPTKRNAAMFKEAGHCYVYLIYGMYHCVNVVTEKENQGDAVLIRALEPVTGVEEMYKRRKLTQNDRNLRLLTSGPGKLCKALKIDSRHSGEDLRTSSLIKLLPYRKFRDEQIAVTPRIGITKAAHFPWRFYLKGNDFVSVHKFNLDSA